VLLPLAEQTVTFVRLEKPSLDMVGVVLGAFGAAGVLVLLALAIGVGLGVHLILRRRKPTPPRVELDLRNP
jgi:hypothetical protein